MAWPITPIESSTPASQIAAAVRDSIDPRILPDVFDSGHGHDVSHACSADMALGARECLRARRTVSQVSSACHRVGRNGLGHLSGRMCSLTLQPHEGTMTYTELYVRLSVTKEGGMSHCVEFVKFRVKAGQQSAFLARRTEAIAAVQAAHPDLIGAPVLAEHDDGSWTDVWIYRTAEAAQQANDQAGGIPAFVAMAALLHDVRVEAGKAPDSANAQAWTTESLGTQQV